MLDISNRQGGIGRTYANRRNYRKMSPMGRSVDIESIRRSLQRIMDQKGVAPTTLSLKVGNSKSLVKDLLERTDDVRLSTLIKLADALNVSIEELLERPQVPIAGYIGAGGEIVFEPYDGAVSDSFVLRPPGISGDLVALMVRGDSMLPKYRAGDVIYVQKSHDGVLPEYIGEDCAVQVVDGGCYIKQLAHGTKPGLYTLRSLNAADIEDVEIEWATPVLFIMPKRARLMVG
jgi:phage repressor protein C with HTH and peptisase S24 domain